MKENKEGFVFDLPDSDPITAALSAVITFEVAPPPKELSSNSRASSWTRNRKRAQYRKDCCLMIHSQTRNMARPKNCKCSISYIWVIGGDHKICRYDAPRDEDNAIASLKTLQDAIVDLKLISNDTACVLKNNGVQIVRDKSQKSHIKVRLEYLWD